MAIPPYTIKEYGVISDGILGKRYTEDSIELDEESFQSLSSFIEENYENPGFDNAFSIFKKSGRRHIRVKNYVGVIETKDKIVIEILPKTFRGQDEISESESKVLLLKLLKSLKNSPFINLNSAHLKEEENFPILEIFISTYLKELEFLLNNNLRGNYISHKEDSPFIKGKVLILENIKRNSFKQSQFYCQFDIFSENIPPNRLIKSTLKILFKNSKQQNNKNQIIKFLDVFENIDFSNSINKDLDYCENHKNLLKSYSNILLWSKIFLKDQSFTNFHGASINQAILFPMEKLFENYIAFLIKKYCDGITISSHDKKYSMIAQKINRSDSMFKREQFPLKPDIVINHDSIIIDTKWKILNDSSRKFGIQEADIYQMHAYGRRYQSGNVKKSAPRLGLIYPKNPNFLDNLLQMKYGEDLLLDVLPFDLSNPSPDEEIRQIINKFLNQD